jgi:aminopeptidase
MALKHLCDKKIKELDVIIKDPEATDAFKERARALKREFRELELAQDISSKSCDALLGALHDNQRLNFLYYAKASPEATKEIIEAEGKEGNWREYTALPVDENLTQQLAGHLMHAAFQHEAGEGYPPFDKQRRPLSASKQTTLLRLSPLAKGTAQHIVSYMLAKNIPFDVDFVDALTKKTVIERCGEEELKNVTAYHGSRYDGLKTAIVIRSPAHPDAAKNTGLDPDGKKAKVFGAPLSGLVEKIGKGEAFYTLTEVPSPKEAELDGINYNDYLKMFFEACDQPWPEIHKANAHLISKLEKAKTFTVIDDDTGTNLTMKIDGQKWANSLVYKNVPGSEVFASPIKDSVTGKLFAKGKFRYDGIVIEDIELEFKEGKVVFAKAKTQEQTDALNKIIATDDERTDEKKFGMRYTGEIALGTNPWLKQHLVNGLLVEKISSSFHLALGGAYEYDHYDGKEVRVDNGNRSSKPHWDITTMLKGPKSRIILDHQEPTEEIVLQAGKFLDPELRVLNEGWAALPAAEIPPYWQARLAEIDSGKAVAV